MKSLKIRVLFLPAFKGCSIVPQIKGLLLLIINLKEECRDYKRPLMKHKSFVLSTFFVLQKQLLFATNLHVFFLKTFILSIVWKVCRRWDILNHILILEILTIIYILHSIASEVSKSISGALYNSKQTLNYFRYAKS